MKMKKQMSNKMKTHQRCLKMKLRMKEQNTILKMVPSQWGQAVSVTLY